MLNYRYTQASIPVPMQAGAQLTVESYLTWTSQSPSEKNTEIVLRVQGDLEEKGAKWKDEWTFTWPDGDFKKLEDAFRLIAQHVELRAARSQKRKEVFVDVYDWLRVGWIDENGTFRGYIRLIKEGKAMDAEFENTPALYQLRTALVQVLSP